MSTLLPPGKPWDDFANYHKCEVEVYVEYNFKMDGYIVTVRIRKDDGYELTKPMTPDDSIVYNNYENFDFDMLVGNELKMLDMSVAQCYKMAVEKMYPLQPNIPSWIHHGMLMEMIAKIIYELVKPYNGDIYADNVQIKFDNAKITKELKTAGMSMKEMEESAKNAKFVMQNVQKQYADGGYVHASKSWLNELCEAIPALRTTLVKHPLFMAQALIPNIIMDLNDRCGWTREQIADWLDTLDVDLSFTVKEDSNGNQD